MSEDLASENDRLRDLLRESRLYARHSQLCSRIGGYGYCNCGKEDFDEQIKAALRAPGGEDPRHG